MDGNNLDIDLGFHLIPACDNQRRTMETYPQQRKTKRRKARAISVVVFTLTLIGTVFGSLPNSTAGVILNGDFDSPNVTTAFVVASTNITDWTVVADPDPANIWGVDHIGTYWRGASNSVGDQSVDIDGTSKLYQEFATTSGTTYEFSFYYSHNSESGTGSSSGYARINSGSYSGSPSSYLLNTGLLTHNTPNTTTNMQWTKYTNTFVADASTATLVFQGDAANGGFGFAVDAVSVTAVPEPSTAIAMGLLGIVGFAGNRRRRRQVSVA